MQLLVLMSDRLSACSNKNLKYVSLLQLSGDVYFKNIQAAWYEHQSNIPNFMIDKFCQA